MNSFIANNCFFFLLFFILLAFCTRQFCVQTYLVRILSNARMFHPINALDAFMYITIWMSLYKGWWNKPYQGLCLASLWKKSVISLTQPISHYKIPSWQVWSRKQTRSLYYILKTRIMYNIWASIASSDTVSCNIESIKNKNS